MPEPNEPRPKASPRDRPRVLAVDDEPMMLTMLGRELPRLGFDVTTAESGDEALRIACKEDFDVALVDLSMPEMDGLEALERLKQESPSTEVVLVTGHGTIESAVAAMRAGGFDYLTKPCRLNELAAIVERATEHRRLKRENAALRRLIASGEKPETPLIAESAAMRRVLVQVDRIARAVTPVLIQGESGTGKELIARMLHRLSPRADKPLVTLNCAAINESLLESELFGHQKGAFTGAHEKRPGLLEAADGGTIFLDEISEMTPTLQPKILRAVESGEIRRLGENRSVHVDVRILAATNRDLEAEVAAGRFRQDLYYRLGGVVVRLPPLRERREDVAPLVRHFATASPNAHEAPLDVAPETLEILEGHDWPGNVRELKNCVDAMLLLATGRSVEPGDLPVSIGRHAAGKGPAGKPRAEPLRPLEEVVADYVVEAVRRSDGNKTKAARALSIDPKTLARHLRRAEDDDDAT